MRDKNENGVEYLHIKILFTGQYLQNVSPIILYTIQLQCVQYENQKKQFEFCFWNTSKTGADVKIFHVFFFFVFFLRTD